jgi:hypothetical protein
MNLKQLLKHAGISNDIIKEVEKKAKQTSAKEELEHQEKAMAMTKMLLNEALKYRKEHGAADDKPKPQKTIIVPNDM